jgi:hypothetical protein
VTLASGQAVKQICEKVVPYGQDALVVDSVTEMAQVQNSQCTEGAISLIPSCITNFAIISIGTVTVEETYHTHSY